MSSLSSDTLINPQDLYDITVSSLTPVGTTSGINNGVATLGCLATTGDGRYFRYIIAGATALIPGQIQQAAAEVTANERIAIAAAGVGATQLVTTAAITVTANQYTGGYVMVATTPGQGYQYQIGTHAAFTSAAATFNLVDPIVVALTTGSTVSLVASPWSAVIVNPTTASGAIVGVAPAATPASFYGWVQTVGPACVLAQGTIVVGEEVSASSTTAGAIVATSGVLVDVGYAMQGITATQYGPIFLNIS